MKWPLKDRYAIALAVLLVAYLAASSAVAIWRYEHFLTDRSGDLLIFEQVLHNTAHGKFFYNNFSAQSHFGDHNSPILGLLALFAVFIPAPYVLYVATALSISVSSIPIYLMSCELLTGKGLALLLTALYLALPGFLGQFYQSFHEINLVLPFLTFAFYFFRKERFRGFVITFTLGLLVKEDVALTLFMFAPYAIVKRREMRWCLFPAAASICWFVLSTKVVIPYFNTSSSYGVGFGYFSSFGSSFTEIAANTFGRPLQTLKILFDQERRSYLLYLLLPVGLVLPFLTWEIMFALPSILLNLLADSGRFRLASFTVGGQEYISQKHMSLMACAFLFIAMIHAIGRIQKGCQGHGRNAGVAIGFLLLAVVLYNDRFVLVRYLYVTDAEIERYLPSAASVNRMLSAIPAAATVTSNRGIAAHLYDKKESYYDLKAVRDSDYVVLTTLDIEPGGDASYLLDRYAIVEADKNIVLLRKKHQSPVKNGATAR